MVSLLHKARLWLALTFLFSVWGCYNNAHVRTQKVLEPGEQANSVSVNMVMGGPGDPGVGVPGFRGEISHIRGGKLGESGIYAGAGLTGEGLGFAIGHHYMLYSVSSLGKFYKYGLQSELDFQPRWDAYQPTGWAIQLRPTISTVTSMDKSTYAGLHGILSFSTMESSSYDFFGSYQDAYTHTAFGIGATFGFEFISFSQKASWQSQLDVSYLLYNRIIGFEGDRYLNTSALVVGVSVGGNSFKLPGGARRPARPSPVPLSPPPPSPPLVSAESPPAKLDPTTGKPVEQEPASEIDPETGLPIVPEKEVPETVRIDPLTGQLITTIEPEPEKARPRLSAAQIEALAKTEARRNHKGARWAFGGGLVEAGGIIGGGILGAMVTESFLGFLVGAGGGGFLMVNGLTKDETDVPVPPQLAGASVEQLNTYRQAYTKETKHLRMRSIVGGALGWMLLFPVLMLGFLLLMFGI